MGLSLQIEDGEARPARDLDSFWDPTVRTSETESRADTTDRPRTQSVPAVERALNILEFLARSQHGASHSQLTRRLQLPRSTCHALLLTFERCGYLERDIKTRRYRLGSKLYTLATSSLSTLRVRDEAAPVLQKLACETGLTAQLAVLLENEAVLIDRIAPLGVPNTALGPGKRVGLHCTALGKALLAQFDDEKAVEMVRKQGFFRHNENTIVSGRKLRMVCEEIRRIGYAIEDEEEEIGLRGIGVPVLDSKGQVLAAISISGPGAQFAALSVLVRHTKDAATVLARRLAPRKTHDHRPAPRAQMLELVACASRAGGGAPDIDAES